MKKLLVIGLVLGFSVSMALVGVASEKIYNIGFLDDITTVNYVAGLGPDSTTYNFAVYNWNYGLYGLTTKTYIWVPSLAEGMPSDMPPVLSDKVDADGNPLYESTVELKQGLMWSDENEFTADDVVFTYKLIAKYVDVFGGNWSGSLYPDLFYDVEKLDDYTVKFYLTADSADFKWGTLMMSIIPKAQWGPIVVEAEKGDTPGQDILAAVIDVPVSLGPFLFEKWEKGAFAINAARSDYTQSGEVTTTYANGAVSIINPGKYEEIHYGTPEGDILYEEVEGPFVDRVIYHIYTDQASAVLALAEGTIDFIHNPLGLSKGFQEQLRAEPAVKMVENDSNGFRYLAFNVRKPLYSYKEFRQAVAYLIDKEHVVETILQGIAFPMYSAVPAGNSYWKNPAVTKIGEGMSRGERILAAVELLKGAGFSWEQEPVVENGELVTKGSGLIMPDGTKVEQQVLLCPSTAYDPIRATFGIWIERWMNDIGIPVKANLTGFNTIVEFVMGVGTPTFDMYILGWGLGNPAFPDFMHAFWHSSQDYPAGFNTPGYKSEAYDEAVGKFVKEWDLAKARDYCFEAQAILAEDLPYVILFDTPLIEAYRDRVVMPFDHALDGLQGVNGCQATAELID